MRRKLEAFALLLISLFACAGCQSQPQVNELENARAAVDQKRFDDALRSADAYLRENPTGPDSARAHYLRGRALEARTKRDDAESNANLREAHAAYTRALSSDPDPELRSYILTGLGNVNYWLGDFAAAERHWTEAHSTLTNDDLKAWVLYRVGLCQQRQGRFPDADKTFAEVQRRYPDNEASDRAKNHQGAKAFFVQVAAFQTAASADQLVASLHKRGLPAQRMLKTDRNLHVAMVGPLKTYPEATAMKRRLAADHPDAIIVP